MNHHNPHYHQDDRNSPASLTSNPNLNEVFAMLQERQLSAVTSSNTNYTTTTTSTSTLPPNTLNGNDTTDNSNNNDTTTNSATNVLANLLAVTWLFVFMWFCCRGRPPGPEHWRGAEIRRRYQEMLARERAKKERKQQSPEYRLRLVQHNLHTRTVIAKDEEGNWTLGPVNYRGHDDIANVSTTTATRSTDGGHYDDIEEEEDNENDYSCVICLDPFHVGDVVSWSRFSKDCHHVYHADCIQPWLVGKRQDECPSCRNRLMLHEPPKSTTNTHTENDGDGDAANEGGVDGEGDIETGANNNATNTQNGDQSQQLDDEDELDKYDDDEEDSFFVIMHGLISRVAKQASYTLIGTKDSMDEKETSLMPPASPFRRVVSYEPMRSSPTTIGIATNRSRPNSFTRSADEQTATSSTSLLQTIQAVQSFESEESTEDREQTIPENIPFRRVQSDIVGSTVSRQHHQYAYPMIDINTTNTTSNWRLSREGTLTTMTTGTDYNDDKGTSQNMSPSTSDDHDHLHTNMTANSPVVVTVGEDVALPDHEPIPSHTSQPSNGTTAPTDHDEETQGSVPHEGGEEDHDDGIQDRVHL